MGELTEDFYLEEWSYSHEGQREDSLVASLGTATVVKQPEHMVVVHSNPYLNGDSSYRQHISS